MLLPQGMRAQRPPGTRPARRWWLWIAAPMAVVAVMVPTAGWIALGYSDRTPAELLDYIDRRLQGHNKLEWLAWPALQALRLGLDAPIAKERLANIPPAPAPPPRRLDIPTPPAVAIGTRVWRVGPDKPHGRIAEVARLARDGDVVEIDGGDYRGDVAVWNQRRLTIRAVGGAARLWADGRTAEGKAIWVIRHGHFDITDIDFVGARAGDGNGAGIRFEGGHLRLLRCLFWGNEMGLMTSNSDIAADSVLEIRNSEFAYSRRPRNGIAHNLYAGTIGRLHVSGSYFHHGAVGHLLKSRARRSEIEYSRFTDEAGGAASYELNFPNGGDVRLVGNVVQQRRTTENGIVISYGEEGYRWPERSLVLSNNTLVNELPRTGAFLRVTPGATSVVTANNLLVGPGGYRVADPLTVFNDQHAKWRDLRLPLRQDYRLRTDAEARPFLDPGALIDPKLVPTRQSVHPRGLQARQGPPVDAGADQLPGQP